MISRHYASNLVSILDMLFYPFVYFAHAQFSPPETVLALPDPGDDLPYVKAMWHYARGSALAAAGDDAAARKEAETIALLGRNADFSGLTAGGVPARELLELARHVVLGRSAQRQGDFTKARREWQFSGEDGSRRWGGPGGEERWLAWQPNATLIAVVCVVLLAAGLYFTWRRARSVEVDA